MNKLELTNKFEKILKENNLSNRLTSYEIRWIIDGLFDTEKEELIHKYDLLERKELVNYTKNITNKIKSDSIIDIMRYFTKIKEKALSFLTTDEFKELLENLNINSDNINDLILLDYEVNILLRIEHSIYS